MISGFAVGLVSGGSAVVLGSGIAVGLVTGGSAVGFAFRSAVGQGSGYAVALLSGGSAADSGQFYRYCWCFWTQNDSFSTFDDTQSKSFLHLPAFLKIQHSFSNEENCKKRDHADRRRHISCSIGFVAFCLSECECECECECMQGWPLLWPLHVFCFLKNIKKERKSTPWWRCFFFAQRVQRTHCSFS